MSAGGDPQRMTAAAIVATLAAYGIGLVLPDDKFTLHDPADATKEIRFDAGNVTPGQKRVITWQDADQTPAAIDIPNVFTAPQTVVSDGGVVTRQAATQDAVRLLGRAGGTASHVATVTTPALSASITVTLPVSTTTLAGLNLTQTWTATQSFTSINANGNIVLTGSTTGVRLIHREGTAGYLTINGGNGDGGGFGGQVIAGGNTWATLPGYLLLDHGTATNARVRIRNGNGNAIADFFTGNVTLASGINLAMSGASTFTSGTGAIALNGNTTVGGSATFTISNQTDGVSSGSTGGVIRVYGGAPIDGAGFVMTGSTNAFASTGFLRVATANILTWNDSSVTLASGINLVLQGTSTATFGTGVVSMPGTAASTSTTTGALVITGGTGMGGALNVGGLATLRATATVQVSDAVTNSTTSVLNLFHLSSGTPTAGFGTALVFRAHSSTGSNRGQAQIESAWVDATDVSRTGRLTLYAADSANIREGIRIESNGSVAMLGFFGASAALQPTAVADASGGSTIDAEARTAINAWLSRARTLGLLAA